MKEVKLEIYVPEEFMPEIRDALHDIGVGRVGDYDHVMSFHQVTGYWRALEGSNPYEGKQGEITRGDEVKMELICPKEKVLDALRVIKKIHPYEEPAIHVLPLLDPENLP